MRNNALSGGTSYIGTVNAHSYYNFMEYEVNTIWGQIENCENLCFRLIVKEKSKFEKMKDRWIDTKKRT